MTCAPFDTKDGTSVPGVTRRVPRQFRRGNRAVLTLVAAAQCVALLGASVASAQTTVSDDFSSPDTLAANYVVDAGAGTLKVENGVLQATAVSPDKVLTHNGTEGLIDTSVTLQANFKSLSTSGTTAAVVKRLSPGTFLRVATTYSSSSLKFTKFENGTRTDLLVVSGLFTLSPNTTYWVRGRIAGNVLTAELWDHDPATGGSAIVGRTYTLTGADATRFGAGVPGRAGIYLDPGETAREFDNLRITGQTAPTGGTTRELVLNPAADTMVKQAQPKTTFGAASVLLVDGMETSGTSSLVHSYLRFNVPQLAPGESISGALLSLQVTNETDDGPRVYRTGTGWTEGDLTYNRRGTLAPRTSTTAIGNYPAMPVGRSSAALSDIAAGQSVSLELAPQSTNGVKFASREAATAAERPQLILKITSP